MERGNLERNRPEINYHLRKILVENPYFAIFSWSWNAMPVVMEQYTLFLSITAQTLAQSSYIIYCRIICSLISKKCFLPGT